MGLEITLNMRGLISHANISLMPTLGRKNFMFCGNHESTENAAIMYSLLGCCKTCGVNPREWLTDVLTRIPVYNNDYSLDLADLLPHNWKALKSIQKI